MPKNSLQGGVKCWAEYAAVLCCAVLGKECSAAQRPAAPAQDCPSAAAPLAGPPRPAKEKTTTPPHRHNHRHSRNRPVRHLLPAPPRGSINAPGGPPARLPARVEPAVGGGPGWPKLQGPLDGEGQGRGGRHDAVHSAADAVGPGRGQHLLQALQGGRAGRNGVPRLARGRELSAALCCPPAGSCRRAGQSARSRPARPRPRPRSLQGMRR